jgi:hypothetical protein
MAMLEAMQILLKDGGRQTLQQQQGSGQRAGTGSRVACWLSDNGQGGGGVSQKGEIDLCIVSLR